MDQRGGCATSRVSLDAIKPIEQQNYPKTSESPKGSIRGKMLQREGSFSPSRARDNGSVFGKSSGFESYRANAPGVGPLDILKQRLAYEWKNIYRTLA